MKKLLIATDTFNPRWDGISSFLNEMIPRIENDYDLRIVAPYFGELTQKFRAKITRFSTFNVRLGDSQFASKVNILILAREIRKADIVWVQSLGPVGVIAVLLSKIEKKPVIMYNHVLEWELYPNGQGLEFMKTPIHFITKITAKKLYNMCNIIMTPSVEQAELLNVLGIKCVKKVVHLGIDINKYKPPANKADAKKKMGIDPSKFIVGYAGRLSLEKDPKTLYRAFLRLAKKYDDVLLLIAGGGRPELETLFTNKPNVIFTGLRNDLWQYYKAMDVYVLPSLTETTSLTTMEAMASGLAVISTPVGFIKEYINDGVNGMLFPKKNAYTLFEKLKYLKDHPAAIKELGINARQTIVENYTWDKTAEGIKLILNKF